MLRSLQDFSRHNAWNLGVFGLLMFTVLGLPYALRVWKDVKEGSDGETTEVEDIIGPLTDAYAAGEISKEEYDRIQLSLEKSDQKARSD